MLQDMELRPAGDGGIVVMFGCKITKRVHRQVCTLVKQLKKLNYAGIREIVPAYCSVMLYYDIGLFSYDEIVSLVKQAAVCPLEELPEAGRILEVPVCYDGVLAPDIEYVMRTTGLSRQELIRIHTAQPLLVYMIGFMPGFPYMGGMPFSLPRQSVPRRQVPPGAVGIAAGQTGIYTVEGPGEWWLIGRTPLRIFDAEREAAFLLAPGDYVQFRPITTMEYFLLKEQMENDEYKLIWRQLREVVE